MDIIHQARLAQSVEHQTWNLRIVGSSPTVDNEFFILDFVASDALLAGRLVPFKWNQAWRPSELYRCIEREKDNFKSREVNCLKECALALNSLLPRALLSSISYTVRNRLHLEFYFHGLYLMPGHIIIILLTAVWFSWRRESPISFFRAYLMKC